MLHLLGKYFCRMQNNKVAYARKLFGACSSWRLLMNSFIYLCEVWTEIYWTLSYILCVRSFSSEGNYKPIDGAVLMFFFFFYWRYNPLWVLAFSVILLHSVLSLLSFLHPLIPNVWISSSISSTHLFLGLPLILLPVGFHSNILLGILFSSIRIACPNQAILLLFINLTMSAFSMNSFNSWFILILHDTSLSCTGPRIFLSILRLPDTLTKWYLATE